ncbi:ARP2/3 actin-organizing complex subunit Arc5 [Schizosaccharomyces cryophilus OY26]|uniref:Actin-related protein 2/3 complex subunit 5 n=1 Tax=Schizosaccharomyces cryophilus (strain OY26 / ATCC MYA-4695 / CBS 11777 / NBRC 106824 / NRRL Y48691) TaxID=653667 RepID=S9X466_SCHCR|nr:ARP2/3 actin-organizing complex subunit Arc5 [Schizosaccharomyces cryophilus OY26]EPY51842.1 ARP2/3 actin-organizing complex subunit Arc5 [Schizosaccharomyces cryophilus OY26]
MSFRMQDVDSVTEPVLTQQDLFPPRQESSEQVQAAIAQLVPQARSTIQAGNAVEGLRILLSYVPFGDDVQEARQQYLSAFVDLLSYIRSTDIIAFLKQRSTEDLDNMMNFIYRALAHPQAYNPSVLLNWHEKIVQVNGIGCITRVLNSRPDM